MFKGKRGSQVKPSSFFPPYIKPRNTNSWEEQLEFIEHLNMLFGGRDIRGKKDEAV